MGSLRRPLPYFTANSWSQCISQSWVRPIADRATSITKVFRATAQHLNMISLLNFAGSSSQ